LQGKKKKEEKLMATDFGAIYLQSFEKAMANINAEGVISNTYGCSREMFNRYMRMDCFMEGFAEFIAGGGGDCGGGGGGGSSESGKSGGETPRTGLTKSENGTWTWGAITFSEEQAAQEFKNIYDCSDNSTLQEFNKMINDESKTYFINYAETENHAAVTSFDFDKNQITITTNSQSATMAQLSEELNHAIQYNNGEMAFFQTPAGKVGSVGLGKSMYQLEIDAKNETYEYVTRVNKNKPGSIGRSFIDEWGKGLNAIRELHLDYNFVIERIMKNSYHYDVDGLKKSISTVSALESKKQLGLIINYTYQR
jgi:hypothetical protein